MAPPVRARDLCFKTPPIKVVWRVVVGLSGVMARAKGFWRRYSQPGIQLVGLRPSYLPSLQHHENIRRGGLDRTSELLRGVERVDRRGKREDRNARYVFASQVFTRPCNASGVRFHCDCDGGVDCRRLGVSKVRRHGHGVVIGQAAK